MGLEVLPAIDLAGGRLARSAPRGPVPVEAFGGDPVAAGRTFAADGARWLHVVDLDLAFAGEPGNLDLVRRLARLPVRLQASGGVVALHHAEAFLDAGATRVVFGSAALADPELLARAVERFGEAVVAGLEVEGNRFRPRGRHGHVDLSLAEALDRLDGAARVLVTAVARVGALEGPDVDAVRRVAALRRPVIAAGGIASIDDLRRLAAVPGVEGAVVGRAALEGRVDLAAAVRALA